jgi:predicted esterase YcpF (UPF0227 family)
MGSQEFDGQKGRIVDLYADALDRRDKNEAIFVFAQNGGEKLDQRRASDRRAHIKPGSVAGDAHVDIAAKWRIP